MAVATKSPLWFRVVARVAGLFGLLVVLYRKTPDVEFMITFYKTTREDK